MKMLQRTTALGNKGPALMAPIRAWWLTLALRERRLLVAGLLIVAAALLWMLALAPALRTLRTAPVTLQSLDRQWQGMQVQADETQRLRAIPPVSREQAAVALKAAADRLGAKAKLTMQGERAVLTVTALEPSTLEPWLAEVRAGARASPLELNLVRSGNGYSGTLVLALGAGR